MGIPDGAHTHGSGGWSGLVAALLVILGAALVVKAGPVVLDAAAALLHLVLTAAAVLLAAAAVGLVAFTAYRVRRRRSLPVAARALPPPGQTRAAQPLPEPRSAIEPAPEVHIHHHWHGVDAEEVAAIIRQQQPAAQPAIEED
jgi:hypothetical protein